MGRLFAIQTEKTPNSPVFDESFGVYYYGEDNLYPYNSYNAVINSPTAYACLCTSRAFIFGNGLNGSDEIKNFITYATTGESLSHLLKKVIESIIIHRVAFIKANFKLGLGGLPEVSSLSMLPASNVRFCFKDSMGYISKVAYSEYFSLLNRMSYPFDKSITKYCIYNENILYDDLIQKPKSEKWDNRYLSKLNNTGVVFILRTDFSDDIYPISRVHSVINDCIIEQKASLYKKNGLSKGFFGRVAIVLPDQEINQLNYGPGNNYYGSTNRENKKEEKEISKWLGADNVGGVIVYRTKNEDLEKSISIKKIDGDINPDIFTKTEVSARENICSVFFNTPNGLIRSNDTFFSTSGEAYKQMKLFLQENTFDEKDMVVKFMRRILSKMPSFYEKFGDMPDLIKLIDG